MSEPLTIASDLWHPVHLIDDGQHLGSRFYSHRNQVCAPQFNGFANVWTDKPEIKKKSLTN